VLENILYIPNFKLNILSPSKLLNHYSITTKSSIILFNKEGDIITRGIVKDNLYWLPIEIVKVKEAIN